VPDPSVFADLSDDLAEIRFYLDQGLEDDAGAALADLSTRHPGHPDIAAMQAELSGVTAAPVEDLGAQPLVDLASDEDEDEDAYLSAIFSDAPAKPKKKRPVSAIADVEDSDPRTHFDLGMAYREMGLIDDAIGQFETAARDLAWKSRALVMSGTLRVHRGETDRAAWDLRQAIETANTEDERSEANYELGVLYEKVGDTPSAIEYLRSVSAGFRDRDERLDALQGQKRA
jgi:tetratricopeptide (TPR) repeat protein